MNPLIQLLLGRILDSTIDWKQLLQRQGLAVVNAKIRSLIHARVDPEIEGIAARMQRDGYTWDGTGKVATMPDEGHGRGYILSRVALYHVIKATGLRGGVIVDAFRDAANGAVWDHAKSQLPAGTPLKDVVRVTLDAWVEVLL